MNNIRISTDGSEIGNTGIGGWAVVYRSERSCVTLSGKSLDTTSNRMELKAILEGLKLTSKGKDIRIRSDSEYAIGVASKEKNAKSNLDLVKEIREVASKREVEWTWVQGHSGDPGNELADDLANEQARNLAEETLGVRSPYIIAGNAYPVKEQLKEHGLRWDEEEKEWITWYREEWIRAVEEIGAERTSERRAVV